MYLKQFIYFLIITVFFISCSTDDDNNPLPEEPATYENGIFILNEGNFGQGNSSVSFIDPATGAVGHNVFRAVNEMDLGDTASDMAFFGDHAYIVLNASNTIEVVDRSTFETVATIETELKNPRQIAFLEGMLYVTNWGEGGDASDDYVAVFDTQDFDLLTRISVEEGPEDILAFNGRIYVAHAGGWSFNDKVSVISGTEVHKVIEVGQVPNSLAAANGNLWVSSAGLPDYAGETAGSISRINLSSLEVDKEFEFSEASMHPKNLRLHNDRVFYTLRNEVYSFSTSAEALPTVSDFPLNEVVFLYGFAIHEGKVYAASANPDFTGNGKLIVYDAAGGNLISQFEAGINPNGIFFNE